MDILEIKQGSFMQRTQYFIPDSQYGGNQCFSGPIDFYWICPSDRHVWESLIFENYFCLIMKKCDLFVEDLTHIICNKFYNIRTCSFREKEIRFEENHKQELPIAVMLF